jgi:hypothetical protein
MEEVKMTPEQMARLDEETVRFIADGQGALSRDGMRSLAAEVLVLRERTETWKRRARRAIKGANARTAEQVRSALRTAVARMTLTAREAELAEVKMHQKPLVLIGAMADVVNVLEAVGRHDLAEAVRIFYARAEQAEQQAAALTLELEAYKAIQRQALDAWATEFQSGGKFAKSSPLQLGDSIIVEGGRWLAQQHAALTQELARVKALLGEAQEAFRANLAYATYKDEQVMLAVFNKIDAALARAPQLDPECASCGEHHHEASMCPPHEVRRGTGPWSRKPVVQGGGTTDDSR